VNLKLKDQAELWGRRTAPLTSVSKEEFKYKIEVMIDPALCPNAVTYIKLELCLWEVISEHDGAMHLVFVSSKYPDIIFHPFQRRELITQSEVENPGFISWVHCRQQCPTNMVSLTFLPLREPKGPKAIIEVDVNKRSSLNKIAFKC